MQTDATTPDIVGPTVLVVVSYVLVVVCKRCNNSQQCWDLQCIVGRIQSIRLWRSCVMRVRGPNNVGLVCAMLCHHGTKELLEVFGSKVWLVLNFVQQLPKTCNNKQQGVQTDAACNIQHCWELLANNVTSICKGLKAWSPLLTASTVKKCHWLFTKGEIIRLAYQVAVAQYTTGVATPLVLWYYNNSYYKGWKSFCVLN